MMLDVHLNSLLIRSNGLYFPYIIFYLLILIKSAKKNINLLTFILYFLIRSICVEYLLKYIDKYAYNKYKLYQNHEKKDDHYEKT